MKSTSPASRDQMDSSASRYSAGDTHPNLPWYPDESHSLDLIMRKQQSTHTQKRCTTSWGGGRIILKKKIQIIKDTQRFRKLSRMRVSRN